MTRCKLLVRKQGLHVAAIAVWAASRCLRAGNACTNSLPQCSTPRLKDKARRVADTQSAPKAEENRWFEVHCYGAYSVCALRSSVRLKGWFQGALCNTQAANQRGKCSDTAKLNHHLWKQTSSKLGMMPCKTGNKTLCLASVIDEDILKGNHWSCMEAGELHWFWKADPRSFLVPGPWHFINTLKFYM